MRDRSKREDGPGTLIFLPIFMGIGHIPPAIGALWAVGKSSQNEIALLVMVASTTVLVDSLDKYKDLLAEDRPRPWAWRLWVTLVLGVAAISTYMCGLSTAIRIHRFLAVGIFWGIPCIPGFSSSNGFQIFKPKAVIRETKSLIVAVCMGFVCAETSIFHACMNGHTPCSSLAIRQRSLCLTILYQFFRETVFDARDIDEDSNENLNTLPVLLGKKGTLIFLPLVGIPADMFLTGGVGLSWAGITMAWNLVLKSLMRVAATTLFSAIVLQYPRENHIAWSSMALFGLLPLLPAQLALGSPQ